MQLSTPSSLYQQALDTGRYQPDAVQRLAMMRLDAIYQGLGQRAAPPPRRAMGLRARLSGILGKNAHQPMRPVQGLYMWGGVGRGKTWLMDMFFHSLPGERKLRFHFHRFILRIHEALSQLYR